MSLMLSSTADQVFTNKGGDEAFTWPPLYTKLNSAPFTLAEKLNAQLSSTCRGASIANKAEITSTRSLNVPERRKKNDQLSKRLRNILAIKVCNYSVITKLLRKILEISSPFWTTRFELHSQCYSPSFKMSSKSSAATNGLGVPQTSKSGSSNRSNQNRTDLDTN